ncbi:MAG: prolyl oligopeptidase family serine peptidase [Sulfitobacter sp.]|nr:prolyl oligopeptidase family serine peptidase [Sulfitobacter sp.]
MRPFLFLLMLLLAPTAYACGPDSDCILGDRSYRISIPEGATAPVGAVIWAHGYRGSAEGVMRNASLRKMLHAQGLALIAAQGVGGTWALPNGPRTPDSTGAAEFAYFNAVIADAKARFGIDPARLVASGFSAGGMMVWNLACAQPDVFAGFVPVSGTFWLQPPAQCASPAASIVHLHGDADSTVPLDGRAIGPTRQGKVSAALAMYSALGGFDAPNSVIAGPLRCDRSANKAGEILEFCLFEGGHSFRTEYLAYALERLKAAGRL